MAIRVRPGEIDIPEDDPFANDLLNRRQPAMVLTNIIRSVEGPCTLSIDASWGSGKTTFLRLWAQHLRTLHFTVIEFNAWETDFCSDPFLALSEAITAGLDDRTGDKKDKLKKTTKEILRRAVPGLIRMGTAGIVDLGPMLEKEVSDLFVSMAEERMAAYEEQRKSLLSFRQTLQQIAKEISEVDCPLVVMIDELDRCRPNYAVEFLEISKHLFSVDNIIFVLAVNRSELKHSVSAVYGEKFDGNGYLRRFIDIDFVLPKPDRTQFVQQLIHSTKIHEYFTRTNDSEARRDSFGMSENILKVFLDKSDASLREIANTIYHLGIVFASLRADRRSFHLPAVVGILLKQLWPEYYRKFCNGEISDIELVDELFSDGNFNNIREGPEGTVFEMAIISAFIEINSGTSRLLEQYKIRAKEGEDSRDRNIAEGTRYMGGRGFKFAIDRIELLSQDLVDAQPNE